MFFKKSTFSYGQTLRFLNLKTSQLLIKSISVTKLDQFSFKQDSNECKTSRATVTAIQILENTLQKLNKKSQQQSNCREVSNNYFRRKIIQNHVIEIYCQNPTLNQYHGYGLLALQRNILPGDCKFFLLSFCLHLKRLRHKNSESLITLIQFYNDTVNSVLQVTICSVNLTEKRIKIV